MSGNRWCPLSSRSNVPWVQEPISLTWSLPGPKGGSLCSLSQAHILRAWAAWFLPSSCRFEITASQGLNLFSGDCFLLKFTMFTFLFVFLFAARRTLNSDWNSASWKDSFPIFLKFCRVTQSFGKIGYQNLVRPLIYQGAWAESNLVFRTLARSQRETLMKTLGNIPL